MSNNDFKESEMSYYGWVVVGIMFLFNMVGYGLVYAYGVFLKPLSSEFGWSRSDIVGAFSFFAISHSILSLFAGRFSDIIGTKLIFAIGGFFLGLSMVLMRYVTSLLEIYIFYGLFLSIGIAATYVPSMVMVSCWFKDMRGFAIGLTTAGLGAGSLVFSPFSAWLISSFGWRPAYTIVGILAWVIFIPFVKFVKQVPHEMIGPELHEGLSFLEAFRTRTFWAYSFTWLLINIPLWAVMIHIVPLATDRGMPMATAGILAGIIGAGSIIGRISAGFLSDKFGRKRILIIEFIIQLMALIWLLFSKESWMLFFFAILFGLCSGGWLGVIVAFPADYFGLKATGAILGFAIVLGGIGVAIGPYLGGYIFDNTQSYEDMVIMCMIATIGAIILAELLRPIKITRRETDND